jgi:ribosome-associated translation inhibitor RaiA
MPRIEELLQQLPPEQCHLCFSFEHSPNGYEAQAWLTLPGGTLLTQTDAPLLDYRLAVDQVVDQLAQELREHHRHLGHPHRHNY